MSAIAATTVSTLAIIAVEIAAAALLIGAIDILAIRIVSRMTTAGHMVGLKESRVLKTTARQILPVAFAFAALGILAYNGSLIARGVDVRTRTLELAHSLTINTWEAFLIALGRLGLAAVGLLLAVYVLRRLVRALQAAATRHERLAQANLAGLFASLDRAIVNSGWILLIALACWLLEAPQSVVDGVLLFVRVYLVLALGLLLIRGTWIVIDLFDRWGLRYASSRGWQPHYEHLRQLLPTLQACAEYALWIGVAALVIVQVRPLQNLAVWGPRLMEAIAIFFLGRVVVEIGRLEIGHRMLPPDELDDTEQRRRATMVPLVRSIFTYMVYFGTVVLILARLGFNPMPFLAGAGILGLVVGFGAQSLINDVVSGFFILFENVYLVGDLIEAAGAKGVVEAIEFRVTKIRDDDGRVHVVRNGDMKPIVNYSKEYAMAVVPVDVAYDADLRSVFATLHEAGTRVRGDDRSVLADTHIDGIVAFGASAMTVRTSTRVRPGSHDRVAAALRLAIKEAFDRQAPEDLPRQTLIPGAARAASRG